MALVLFSPSVLGWVGGRREKFFPGCISETVRYRKLILGREIGGGCRCATSWCDLDLLFKRPARDACVYMGEADPDPHFLLAIALQP